MKQSQPWNNRIFFFLIMICLVLSGCGSSHDNNDSKLIGNINSFEEDNEELQTDSIKKDKRYTGKIDASRGYYTDMSEGSEKFIDRSNEKVINDGFYDFYCKTGVFPHLYIIENAPASSDVNAVMQTYTNKLYEELFDAEGNLLIVYVASENDYWIVGGYNIGKTLNEEDISVIYKMINDKWGDGNLANRFGLALKEAASIIMDEP